MALKSPDYLEGMFDTESEPGKILVTFASATEPIEVSPVIDGTTQQAQFGDEDEDGNYVFGNKAGIPHKNRKARRFECWLAVLKRDGETWSFDGDLEMWDQGGTIWITTEEEEPQNVGIKMRNVVWPTGTSRNSLVLYAYREDRDRAVSYVWGEPTASRLAITAPS